jgi:mono/diheme cytochrome c family protein
MGLLFRLVIGLVIAALVMMAALVGYARVTGLRARATPMRAEAALAAFVRSWSMTAADRDRANPVARTPEVIRTALEHFADHCASCHANDGSGSTTLGKSFFPPAPDMRAEATQGLTDGELFYIVEHGIRFTGMPAWSTGTADGERASWELVHFIRHLPDLSPEELEIMQGINPRPPSEIREEIEAERFLEGR